MATIVSLAGPAMGPYVVTSRHAPICVVGGGGGSIVVSPYLWEEEGGCQLL